MLYFSLSLNAEFEEFRVIFTEFAAESFSLSWVVNLEFSFYSLILLHFHSSLSSGLLIESRV